MTVWLTPTAPPAPPAQGEESVLRENVPRPAAQAKRPAAGSPPSQKRHFSSNSILREEISSDSTALTSAKAALGRAADLLEREGKGVGAARAPAAPAYARACVWGKHLHRKPWAALASSPPPLQLIYTSFQSGPRLRKGF